MYTFRVMHGAGQVVLLLTITPTNIGSWLDTTTTTVAQNQHSMSICTPSRHLRTVLRDVQCVCVLLWCLLVVHQQSQCRQRLLLLLGQAAGGVGDGGKQHKEPRAQHEESEICGQTVVVVVPT